MQGNDTKFSTVFALEVRGKGMGLWKNILGTPGVKVIRFSLPESWVHRCSLDYDFFLIYLFLAVLGLRCCSRAFSSCGERGLLFVVVRGLLIVVASLVAEHRL